MYLLCGESCDYKISMLSTSFHYFPFISAAPQSVQQQLVHQQIVTQLRTAVQAGLINPQLLNQQLTPAMLVTLQQLLQLQTILQRLIAQEQVLQQNKTISSSNRQNQLEQLHLLIKRTKQQIEQNQMQISNAQQNLHKSVSNIGDGSTPKDISVGLASLGLQQKKEIPLQQPHIKPVHPLVASGGAPRPAGGNPISATTSNTPQHQGSKLSQWRKPLEGESSSKAPGAKLPTSSSILQSSNSPFLDVTWSENQDPTWPTISSSTSSLHTSHSDGKTVKPQSSNLSSTILSTGLPISSGGLIDQKSLDDNASVHSSTSQDDKNSLSGSAKAVSNVEDMIEEFVPGKPWQGTNIKNPEDDPDITPGDCMNVMNNLSWGEPTALKSQSVSDTWGMEPKIKHTWSSGSSESWKNSAKSTRTPPGFANQNKPPNWSRSMSWAPG